MATATFTAENGKAYSLRAIERDLVAFMHGEQTDVPASVIEEALKSDASVAEVWEELQSVAEALEYLPSVQPSRYFVRELVEALPALRADGRASARLEELVLRTKWTVEDRLAFTVEYWRYRFRNHPVSSAGLAAATVLLVVTFAWLPGMYFLPPGTVPDFPGLSSDSGGQLIADARSDRSGAPPIGPGSIPPPVDEEEGWLDDRFVDPDLVIGPGGFDLPPEIFLGPREDAIDRPEQPDPGFIHRPDDRPRVPEGGLPARKSEVLPFYEARQLEDGNRDISPREREMIDLALRWLAANQNADGSWGHAESFQARLDAERTTEPTEDRPDRHGRPPTSQGDRNVDNDDADASQTEPVAGQAAPEVVQTTARVMLAFLAENYASRLSDREELRPRRSRHSPVRASHFEEHKEQLRKALEVAVSFLRANQDPQTGRLAAEGPNSTIAHAEALKALSEDYLLSGNPRLIVVLPNAATYLVEARNRDGGWGAEPGAPSSAEATLAAVQALMIYARTPTSQLEIHAPVFAQAARFATDNATDLIYQHAPRSAAAVLALYQVLSLPELELDMSELGLEARTALSLICESVYRPQWRMDRILGSTPVDFTYWVYASQAIESVANAGRHRGDIRTWRRALIDALDEHRITQLPERSREAGEVYWPVSPPLRNQPGIGNAWVSASAVLSLQNSYRYSWLYTR